MPISSNQHSKGSKVEKLPPSVWLEDFSFILNCFSAHNHRDWIIDSKMTSRSEVYNAMRGAIIKYVQHKDASIKYKDIHIQLMKMYFNTRFLDKYKVEDVLIDVFEFANFVEEVSDSIIKSLGEEIAVDVSVLTNAPDIETLGSKDEVGKVEEVMEFLPLKPVRAQKLDEDEHDPTVDIRRSNSLFAGKNPIVK